MCCAAPSPDSGTARALSPTIQGELGELSWRERFVIDTACSSAAARMDAGGCRSAQPARLRGRDETYGRRCVASRSWKRWASCAAAVRTGAPRAPRVCCATSRRALPSADAPRLASTARPLDAQSAVRLRARRKGGAACLILRAAHGVRGEPLLRNAHGRWARRSRRHPGIRPSATTRHATSPRRSAARRAMGKWSASLAVSLRSTTHSSTTLPAKASDGS